MFGLPSFPAWIVSLVFRSDCESVLCPGCWLQFGSGLATVLLVELKSVSHGLRAVVSDFASQGGVGV